MQGDDDTPVLTAAELEMLVDVRPSPRQLAWQALEFYAFLHFGMNTMTDREWGLGDEDPALFDPQDFDADQWMAAVASADMKGAILTAKHHDGFCLWPSAETEHTVARSPWRDGSGDMVRELADAAHRHGLTFGIYLSPWDRADARYGSGAAYDDYVVAQLRELLTGYGPIFSVWFDGACGEGPNGKVQVYDWQRYYATIRELQPGAVISVCGPDTRWCGNEAGHFRAAEWSVVPRELQEVERIADKSQQADDPEFASRVHSEDDDLGSRAAIAGHERDLVWYPAEVNTSIRPGWFHHEREDAKVKSVDHLWEVYCGAVGGNATFLLNVPADRRGLVADPDVATLAGLGDRVRSLRRRALATSWTASSGTFSDADQTSASAQQWGTANAPDPALGLTNGTGWWQADADDTQPVLTIALPEPTRVDTVIVKEEITQGQRIEDLLVRGWLGSEQVLEAETSCVGYQRILEVEPVAVDRVTLQVRASRSQPTVAGVAVLAAADR